MFVFKEWFRTGLRISPYSHGEVLVLILGNFLCKLRVWQHFRGHECPEIRQLVVGAHTSTTASLSLTDKTRVFLRWLARWEVAPSEDDKSKLNHRESVPLPWLSRPMAIWHWFSHRVHRPRRSNTIYLSEVACGITGPRIFASFLSVICFTLLLQLKAPLIKWVRKARTVSRNRQMGRSQRFENFGLKRNWIEWRGSCHGNSWGNLGYSHASIFGFVH